MATVLLQPEFARRNTAGQRLVEVDADTCQALIERMDERFPGFADAIATGVAVAIDGQIYPDPLQQDLRPDSEVCFLPALEGG
ncbi:MAG: MoaD/ThiS family protein [Gammaproteobacteria bacterium]|nr:MoaD/ThiS family protein [Gammaproteobacteria bacterium]